MYDIGDMYKLQARDMKCMASTEISDSSRTRDTMRKEAQSARQ